MTQQAVERALGKLLTDENFRDQFFANPEIATWEAGFTLSAIELEALSGCRTKRYRGSASISTNESADPPSTPIAGRRERRSAHDEGRDRSSARAQERNDFGSRCHCSFGSGSSCSGASLSSGGASCVLTGIGIGTFVATLARSATPSSPASRGTCWCGGSGVDVAYMQLLMLGVIASVLLGFSAWKFRGQMS